MTGAIRIVIGGVDTHKDAHVAAAIDSAGRLLGTASFPTTPAGYDALDTWLSAFGTVERIGIEGTSSYGSGLTRFLLAAGRAVVEVVRPNRQLRRQRGKSDAIDAEAAARAALAQQTAQIPTAQNGTVEVLRVLRLQRRSATDTGNEFRAAAADTPPDAPTVLLRPWSLPRSDA